MTILQELLVLNPEAALFDDRFIAAIIGIGYRSFSPPVAIYSKKQLYATLANTGMTAPECEEYYAWHIAQLNAGEHTPVIFDDTALEDN
jgi:hypothetical protein